MSDDGISEGIVTRSDLAKLAELFDRFEFALDPLSREAHEARSQFNNIVRDLFKQRGKPTLPENSTVTLLLFETRIRCACRHYLKKNAV
ncbi:MAG: hypothetical protein EXS33_01215 [Pedosphaera sp.]|nr:hypothetical protein [Pedosphaera sp.]